MNAWIHLFAGHRRMIKCVMLAGMITSELINKPGTNTVMTSALAIRSSRTVPKFIQAPAVALALTT